MSKTKQKRAFVSDMKTRSKAAYQHNVNIRGASTLTNVARSTFHRLSLKALDEILIGNRLKIQTTKIKRKKGNVML